MKKIVCMDLGNTIIHNDILCFEKGYEKLYHVLEITQMDLKDWKQRLEQLCHRMYAIREKNHIEVPFQEFLKKVIEIMDIQTMHSLDELELIFYQSAAIDSIEGDILDFFDFLRDKNISVYVISNSTFSKQCLYDTLEKLGLKDKVVELYSSADIGIRKPDARFFKQITSLQSFSKQEIMYIGNDEVIDYHFAKNIGVEFIWYNHEHKNANINDVVIENYHELIKIWGEKFD